mmetsp:Transcript_31183/g.96510  ORF Transcript_31183/g.96510 Transcript_31183/m.96510 type:complete len:304 (-) Transcript_31183:144-1055(-)
MLRGGLLRRRSLHRVRDFQVREFFQRHRRQAVAGLEDARSHPFPRRRDLAPLVGRDLQHSQTFAVARLVQKPALVARSRLPRRRRARRRAARAPRHHSKHLQFLIVAREVVGGRGRRGAELGDDDVALEFVAFFRRRGRRAVERRARVLEERVGRLSRFVAGHRALSYLRGPDLVRALVVAVVVFAEPQEALDARVRLFETAEPRREAQEVGSRGARPFDEPEPARRPALRLAAAERARAVGLHERVAEVGGRDVVNLRSRREERQRVDPARGLVESVDAFVRVVRRRRQILEFCEERFAPSE